MQFRKQTDLKVLCLYVADPATFLASNSVLVTSFHSENNLFIQLLKKKNLIFYYDCVNVESVKNSEFEFLHQKLHSAPLKFPPHDLVCRH